MKRCRCGGVICPVHWLCTRHLPLKDHPIAPGVELCQLLHDRHLYAKLLDTMFTKPDYSKTWLAYVKTHFDRYCRELELGVEDIACEIKERLSKLKADTCSTKEVDPCTEAVESRPTPKRRPQHPLEMEQQLTAYQST